MRRRRWARRLGLGGRRWDVIQRWFAQVRATVDSVQAHRPALGGGGVLMSVIHVAMRLCVLPALVLGRGRERAARATRALAARASCTARRWFRRRAAAARWSWRFARRSPA